MKPEVYLYPKTAEEAVEMLKSYQGKAMLMSGGTDLVLWMKHGAGGCGRHRRAAWH